MPLTKVDPKMFGGGAVLQVVQSVKTDNVTTTSTSFIDLAGLSVTITPSSASSKILVSLNIGAIANTLNAVKFNILRNGVAIAQPDTGSNKSTINTYPGGGLGVWGGNALWLDSPNTTSAVTYKVQWCVDGSTGYMNRHTGNVEYTSVSSITATEIAG
jgi:hypothetical protein